MREIFPLSALFWDEVAFQIHIPQFEAQHSFKDPGLDQAGEENATLALITS
jgi:hypothetical protein